MIEALAQNLGLGSLLDALRSDFGGYDILDHWQRGEFHHDLVVRVEAAASCRVRCSSWRRTATEA